MTAYIHPKILTREIRHFHLFCGLGGGAKGFNKANPRVGNLQGKFRCIGGIDVNAAAIRDFERLSGSRGTVLDLFDRDQFKDFHGKEPPREWREATAADIRHGDDREFGKNRTLSFASSCNQFIVFSMDERKWRKLFDKQIGIL